MLEKRRYKMDTAVPAYTGLKWTDEMMMLLLMGNVL